MPKIAEFNSRSHITDKKEGPDMEPLTQPAPSNGPGIWLHCAAGGLCVLAAAAAAVSFTAQYRLVYAARRLALIAGLEAAIPDAAALVFACLGVALALHGRHAIRARVLNVASAGAVACFEVARRRDAKPPGEGG